MENHGINEARHIVAWRRPPKHLRQLARCLHGDRYADCPLCTTKTKRWTHRASSTVIALAPHLVLVIAIEITKRGQPRIQIAHVRGRSGHWTGHQYLPRAVVNEPAEA